MKRMLIGSLALAGLFAAGCAGGVTQLQSRTLAKTSRSWDGAALPAYPEGTPEVTILRIQIPPHTALDMHKHPVINAGVLVSGTLTVVADTGETLHLRAGDPIVELVDTWHYGRNDGDTAADIIVFYAGVRGRPITVKQAASH